MWSSWEGYVNWNEIVDKVTPHILKIETPGGHGSGFLCLYNHNATYLGIATAHHVIGHATKWLEPVRLTQYPSGKSVLIQASKDRVIWANEQNDSAVMIVPKDHVSALDWPDSVLPLLPIEKRLPIGSEIGWLGYPALGPANMVCFFNGIVSAWQDSQNVYLVDGVAINGCSGGPVVCPTSADGVQIVGALSAYIANRATGEALPGLSVAQDVSYFIKVAEHVKTVDDARKQQEQQERERRQAGNNPAPSPSTEAT